MNRGVTYSALLKGTSYRHCFISFPHHWRAFISPATIPTFIIESRTHSVVGSWAGHTHDQENDEEIFVCINSKLLQFNGFSEREAVIVRQVVCPAPCTSASMTVLCDSDWEQLNLNMDAAQNAFLSQFRVIKIDQIFPLWLEGGLVIYLKVNSCVPSSAVSLLQQNTEVNVVPLPQGSSNIVPVALKPTTLMKKQIIDSDAIKYKEKNILRIIYTFFALLGYERRRLETLPKQDVFLSLKVVNFILPSSENHQHMLYKLLTRHPSIIIVSERNFKSTKFEAASYFISKIYKHNLNIDKNADKIDSTQENSNVVLSVVMFWEKLKIILGTDKSYIDDIECILRHKTCILGNSLRKKLLIDENGIVILDTLNMSNESKSFHIDIETVNSRKDVVYSTITAAMSELSNICPIVFNDQTLLNINLEGKYENVLLSTRDGNPIIVNKENISRFSFHVDRVSSKQLALEINADKEETEFDYHAAETVVINEETFNKLLNVIKRDLHLEINDLRISPQFILLQGNKSSGKTTMIKDLVKRLSGYPYYVHCHVISMKVLKGKKVESVQKLFKPAISNAINLKPSLLVLDDLDFLTNVNTLEEKGAAYEYANHMAFMVKNLLSQLLDMLKSASRSISNEYAECVTVVATCLSRNDVHPLLASSKGNYIFSKSFSIGALSKESKLSFFQHSLENMHNLFMREHKKIKWIEKAGNIFIFKKEEIILKLDNLNLSDLKNFSIRVFLEAKKRWLKDSRFLEDILYIDNREEYPFQYTDTDVVMAYDGFISSSMKVLNIHPMVKKVIKIGGLRQAKQILEEMILWPSKYPQIFSQTSLKLRSGILLYGPPGCGKTLLAKSFENYPHLNFITVKGPELLSKYIGQSEKAVRDAFERAENAKPCVLFFDEFESIAPRRGHDSTGVTDRVVNQLLTKMDGVEGLNGVYVLGATSRPELIDPAILRPGRLDKGVYCPMPDENDREEILNILCEDINLEDLIDIRDIARKTKGYSGADLQSILSTALVKAAQISIGSSLYEAITEDSIESSENYSLLSELASNSDVLELKNEKELLHLKKSYSNTNQLSLCVTLEHISEALIEVKPSVNEQERLRYEALHKKFSSTKESKNFATVMPGKKETLA